MATHYKVVRKTPLGRLVSAIARAPFNRTYQPGVRTAAFTGTGLLVFDDEREARNWAYSLGGFSLQVWSCLVENPVTLPEVRAAQLERLSPGQLVEWWKGQLQVTHEDVFQFLYGHPSVLWPRGTHAYEYVTLEKELT